MSTKKLQKIHEFLPSIEEMKKNSKEELYSVVHAIYEKELFEADRNQKGEDFISAGVLDFYTKLGALYHLFKYGRMDEASVIRKTIEANSSKVFRHLIKLKKDPFKHLIV